MHDTDDRRKLAELIAHYNRDPDEDILAGILALLERYFPDMAGHFGHSRCAYEQHMILDSVMRRCGSGE